MLVHGRFMSCLFLSQVGSEAGTVVAVVIVVLTAVVFFVARFVGGSKQKALDAENYQVCGLIKRYESHGWRFLLGMNAAAIVICDVMISVLVLSLLM